MTDPTPLSPAAQAVLDAANGRSSYGPDDCLSESRWIAAAALRALGSQLGHEIMGVRVVDCSQIQLVAAELEANA